MKKYLIVLLSAIMIISCTTVLIACSSKEDNKPNTPQEQTQQLIAPSNLAINNQTVSWATVINANGYTVRVGSTEHSVASGTSFDLSLLTLDDGTYQISVKAIGQTVGNIRYTDSAYSTAVDYVAKASIKEGTYRLTSITYDGKTYDMTKNNDVRDFYKANQILTAKMAFFMFFGIDFNNLEILKALLTGLFDFTGINTTEQFWDAYVELLMNTDGLVDYDDFVKSMTTLSLIIEGNTMIFSDGLSEPSSAVKFTLDNGVITLLEPSELEYALFTYVDNTITMTSTSDMLSEDMFDPGFKDLYDMFIEMLDDDYSSTYIFKLN